MIKKYTPCILFLLLSSSCASLVSCAPLKFNLTSSSGEKTSVGISPSSVKLSWAPSSTSDHYEIYSLNQASTPVQKTVFTQATLSSLTADSDYTLSVFGIRGAGYKTDPLAIWNFRTWPDFSDVALSSSLNPSGEVSVSWNYQPWNDGGLPTQDDTANQIVCSFIAAPSTSIDPNSMDPFAASSSPVTAMGQLKSQSLRLDPTVFDPRTIYVGGCKAVYPDGTTSVSKNHFITPVAHLVAACPSTVAVGSNYSCSPNIASAVDTRPLGYSLSIDTSSTTCNWISVTSKTQLTGTPNGSALGSCVLSYTYTVPDISFISQKVSTTIVVTHPGLFTSFPSFAVRALSGAVAYPYLKYLQAKAGGNANYPQHRARISSDLISDFGYGSSYFAGGNSPFPYLAVSSPSVSSTFLYGFPVMQASNGAVTFGLSLDAIRPLWNSNDLVNDGFIRGNLIIPKVSIKNATFLQKTGRSAAPSLYTFLSSPYTIDGGTLFSPVPLSFYLNTNVDFTGANSPWHGSVYEQSTVTIRPPTAAIIQGHLPVTGLRGQANVIQNADPSGIQPQGLIADSSNNFDYYVVNCPTVSPSDPNNRYSVPSACNISPKPKPTCYGDLIVQGPLLLVDAQIQTDKGGCRIYATDTVFIQGSLQAVNASSGTPEVLQISSAKGIILGYSQQSLGVKGDGTRSNVGVGLLDQTFANATLNPFLTAGADAEGSASTALNAIAKDVLTVNLHSVDVSNAYASGNYSYQRLVLSAPYIFSNYGGRFNGAIIAEVALFSDLNFVADPTLIGVPYFPLLTGTESPLTISP